MNLAPATASPPTLRPYRVAALDRLDAAVASGTRRVLMVAPTGSGKLVIAADKVKRLGAAPASARFIRRDGSGR